MGSMQLLDKLFRNDGRKILKRYQRQVSEINSLEEKIKAFSDEKLSKQTDVFKERLSNGENLDDILAETFAVVRETSKRLLNERHYDVQLLGGMVLHNHAIAEMRTGEGKTLVATLPVYLNALMNKGVHVITVNDYLSRRDAVWMGQIYSFLGLSIGVIGSDSSFLYDKDHKEGSEEDKERDETGSFKVQYDFLKPCTRREAYEADITYGTNNEFGFDYLRDNLEYSAKDLRQRDLHYAVIDEVDSILIDEARTPLIISAPSSESESLYETFSRIAGGLKEGEDFSVDEKFRSISLTDNGIEKTEKILGIGNIYTDKGIKYVHHLETSVRAKALFEKDKHYVVKNDEVIIVDEFTGRLQPGRRWSEGLHQAIEAKEGVSIQKESRTFGSITYQNYFRMYERLAGMTGTALTSEEEFRSVYNLATVAVPTHRDNTRIDHNDLIFRTEKGKFQALSERVRELHEKGQPVLIGTVSIEKNELLGNFLKKEGIPHEMLNAKNHEREGEIIAQAGERGKVTVATNMAGRGVDIKLGGTNANESEREEIKKIGGLYVIGTERHEARRIDNQLRGRSGRQGDLGETQFFVSLEDSLMRVFATDMVKGMMEKLNIPENQPIQNKMVTRSLESAQKKIEGFHFDARKHVLAYDDVLSKQREAIYSKRRTALIGSDEEVESLLHEMVGEEGIIKEQKESLGEEYYSAIRRLILQSIDTLWVEHLEMMDYMRGSVSLRAYGQRDPLIEYRKEGLRLFRELEASISEHVKKLLPNIGVGAFVGEKSDVQEIHEKPQSVSNQSPQISVRKGKKFGRNEMVTITNGTETKTMKYKKVERLIKEGAWKITS